MDLHRLPSSFNIGVWILRKHNKTTRLCDKLDYQRLCPFCINKNDVTFRLALGPPQLRILHSSLLEPYRGTTIPDCITPPPPSIKLEDGPEYEVAIILDSKIVCNKLHYLVDWLEYSPSECTW